MALNLVASPANSFPRILCMIVLVLVLLAALYAGWIGVINFSRIRV